MTRDLVLGFQLAYLAQNGMTFWSYVGKYNYDKATLLAQYSPMAPDKFNFGIVAKPSQRLNLFSEYKVLNDNRSECMTGFRARFQEGMVTGHLSSNGKATSIYKHYL